MLHREQGVPLLGFLAIQYHLSSLYVISWLGFLSESEAVSLFSYLHMLGAFYMFSAQHLPPLVFLSREALAQPFWFPAMGTAPCSHEWHSFSAHYPSGHQCQLLGLEYSIPRAKCFVILFHFCRVIYLVFELVSMFSLSFYIYESVVCVWCTRHILEYEFTLLS